MSLFIGKVLSIPYCVGHTLISLGTLKAENRYISRRSRDIHLVVFWKKNILKLKNVVFNDKKNIGFKKDVIFANYRKNTTALSAFSFMCTAVDISLLKE